MYCTSQKQTIIHRLGSNKTKEEEEYILLDADQDDGCTCENGQPDGT